MTKVICAFISQHSLQVPTLQHNSAALETKMFLGNSPWLGFIDNLD